MAIREKFFPGTAVSRYLPPGERSFDEAVYQSGRPVLDSELIFSQEVGREMNRLLMDRTCPSGWLRGPTPHDPLLDFQSGPGADDLLLRKRTALVANMPVSVEYTNTITPGQNLIQFDPAPVFGGPPPDVKRTDFVFLEVFRCVVSSSPRASATVEVIDFSSISPGDQIVIGGFPLTATAAPPLVDEFLIGGTNQATATNIAGAIQDPLNSFVGICGAQTDFANPALVNLRAADPFAGAAGNAITLSVVLALPGTQIEINGGTLPTTFSGGSDTPNKPTQASLYRHGNTQAPVGVALPDDITDPVVGAESTKRVQIQYRIRVTGQAEAVNYKTEGGFDNPNVLAQGTGLAPLAGYPFVPADGTTVSGNSSAVAYQTQDPGLWIAGDGTLASALALGTVDGFVYAIPIAMVNRRNDASVGPSGQGFDPLNNTNGALSRSHAGFVNPIIGVIPAGTSDRPDGRFHDALLREDVLDLRKEVVPGGLDLKAELERQMTLLLDGELKTWQIDTEDKQTLGGGSGDVGTRFLVCNEIGRSGAKGGISPTSGNTPRGVSVADFDHVRRRFADWAVVERCVFPILPTADAGTEPGLYVQKVTPLHPTWEEGDVINVDLDSLDATGLGDWLNNPSGAPTGGGAVAQLWPPGTRISNVLRVIHDDGNWNLAVDKSVALDQVLGIGTSHVQLRLAENTLQATGGLNVAPYDLVSAPAGVASPRRIFVELEITYPIGSGTTDTVKEQVVPAPAVYSRGPLLENDTAQRPDDWEQILPPAFRQDFREVALEYVANDGSGPGSGTPLTENLVADGPLQIRLPRRIFGSNSALPLTSVTDQVSTLTRNLNVAGTTWGSSERVLALDAGTPLSGAQTQVSVEYFAQDPLPNAKAGYQLAVYFRAAAPQTVGVQAGAPATVPLPANLLLRPLVMSRDLWTVTAGKGSAELTYPYGSPSDQIPVHGDIPLLDFPGEWILSAVSEISVGDFSASTGLLNLHQMVPADGNQNFTFSNLDVDPEFRIAYKASDPSTYRPTAMAQGLSSPTTHKVWFPFLARAESDGVYWRAGEVLLVVVSRFAQVQENNTVVMLDGLTCAGIYRTRGMLLLASE
jgi:hypothetical protein